MRIDTGLFDHAVLQRAAGNASDAAVTGTAAGTGPVLAHVTAGGKTLPGFAARVVGAARGGRFAARLRGLPAGGPFEVELTVKAPAGDAPEQVRVRDVLVGDVWLLAGQSNMQGYGRIVRPPPADPAVRAFYMNDEWDVARDPIHNLNEAVDAVHNGWPDPEKPRRRSRLPARIGAGPGVPFGLAMRRLTGVPQGLIACAHGGTSMEQWDPARKRLGSRSLFGALCRRLRKTGGRVAGVLWYQGESDTNEIAAKRFAARLQRLIRALRREARDPALPFVMVQLARVFNHGAVTPAAWAPNWWNRIQEIQRLLSERVPHCAAVPAIDLPLDDTIHVSEDGMRRLGARLAGAMAALRRLPGGGPPPIALQAVTARQDPIYGNLTLRVTFRNVVGRLVARGEPLGFAVVGPAGTQGVYRVDLERDAAVLRVAAVAPGAGLYYGDGFTPVCTITDEADRSLPVFGPLPVASGALLRRLQRALAAPAAPAAPGATPLAAAAWVSQAQPVPAGGVKGLAYPAHPETLGWKRRVFTGGLWDLHCDLFNCAPRDALAWFRCQLTCPEPMNLSLGLGYDGPVRMWINRKPVFCDPKGTNPAGLDKALVRFRAPRGRHELLFAMTSNHGRAWGVKVRAMRTDLTARQLARPSSFRMPVFSA